MKMSLRAASVLAVAALLYTAEAAYPSSYPFENESVIPPGPIASTPSYSYDEEDAGGYVYTYGYTRELTDEMIPFSFANGGKEEAHVGGVIQYFMAFFQGAPAISPVGWWNCSSRWNPETGLFFIIESGKFINTVAGIKMCEEGECCKHLYGFPTFFGYAPREDDYTREAEFFEGGMCDDIFSYEVYCHLFDGGLDFACYDVNLSASDRLVVNACFDNYFRYLMQCKLYVTTGMKWDPAYDPESYTDSMSAEELNSWSALTTGRYDKVCNPYSYYHPESAAGSGSQSSSGNKSDDSSGGSVAPLSFAFLLAML